MRDNTAPSAAQPLKVLVVDDTATNRQILEVFLRKLGFEVVSANDGAAGVQAFVSEGPDIVLMDVMMPVMDGYEATRRIKQLSQERWMPVVFLSALDKEENLVAGLDSGGDDYLSKPINFVILDAKLRSVARTLELQRSLEDSRQRHLAITRNVVDGLITIDEQGTIQSVNPAVLRIFGYAEDELVGANVRMLMPEPHSSAHDGYLARYVMGGEPHIIGKSSVEVQGLRKDGSLVDLSIGISELRLADGRHFVGVIQDISGRKAAEARLRETAASLQRYHDEREAENVLAQEIILCQTRRPGLSDPRVHHWLLPAANFSGDIIAAERASDGKLYALLADATGHGLAAAVSVLPIISVFYNLVSQRFPLGYLVYELNRHMREAIPLGRFVAANLLCIDSRSGVAEIWNGGMPDILLIGRDGKVRRRFPSVHLPLGVVDLDEDMGGIERVEGAPGEKLACFSDGLIEATNAAGESFGQARLEAAVSDCSGQACVEAVKAALGRHIGGIPPHDDVSLLLIDCEG